MSSNRQTPKPQATSGAQDGKKEGADATQPGTPEAAQRPFTGDLEALGEMRAEWDRKKQELVDYKQKLDDRAAQLDERAKVLDEQAAALDAQQKSLGTLPARDELQPGEFAVLFLDENNVLVRNHYADIDELIGHMKIARRDVHMAAAREAGLEVHTEDAADAV